MCLSTCNSRLRFDFVIFATMGENPLRKERTVFFEQDSGSTIICINFNRLKPKLSDYFLSMDNKHKTYWVMKLMKEIMRISTIHNYELPNFLHRSLFNETFYLYLLKPLLV